MYIQHPYFYTHPIIIIISSGESLSSLFSILQQMCWSLVCTGVIRESWYKGELVLSWADSNTRIFIHHSLRRQRANYAKPWGEDVSLSHHLHCLCRSLALCTRVSGSVTHITIITLLLNNYCDIISVNSLCSWTKHTTARQFLWQNATIHTVTVSVYTVQHTTCTHTHKHNYPLVYWLLYNIDYCKYTVSLKLHVSLKKWINLV